MFKGNKKVWKGIAVLVALCMLPTFVLADTANTIDVSGNWATYDSSANTVTVTGTISSADADVTILAVRDAAAVTEDALGAYDDATLKAKVIYIDQEAFEGGNFTFEFIPRSGVAGGKITVFVGGENVEEVKSITIDAAVSGPDIAPATPWYKGEDLAINVYKKGTTDAFGDDAAVSEWIGKIDAIKVNGSAFDKANFTANGTAAVMANAPETVTSIEITTVDGEYTETSWTGSVTQTAKAAGSIAAVKSTLIAGVDSAVFTVTDSTPAGWVTDISSYVTVNDAPALATLIDDELTVELPSLGSDTESADYTVVIAKPNYAKTNPVTVTVKAPTKADADALSAPSVVYSDTEFYSEDPGYEAAEDKQNSFGKASVELPATGANGSVITWEIDGEEKSGKVDLERAAADELQPKTSYEAVATITVDGFKTVQKTFQLTVNPRGTAGTDVAITLNFGTASVAELASVKIDGKEATRNENVFTVSAVASGDHNVIITRPGYVSLYYTLTLDGDEVTAGDTEVTMIAGDVNDDGKVNITDFNLLKAKFNQTVEVSDATNFNADTKTNITDFNLLKGNFNYSRPAKYNPVVG